MVPGLISESHSCLEHRTVTRAPCNGERTGDPTSPALERSRAPLRRTIGAAILAVVQTAGPWPLPSRSTRRNDCHL